MAFQVGNHGTPEVLGRSALCLSGFRAIFRGEMLVFWEGNTAPEMCVFLLGEKMMMMMIIIIIIIIIILIIIIMIYPGLVN